MKITVPQMILVWKALEEIELMNDSTNPRFTTFKKRFQINVRPEIAFWDGLTTAERATFAETELPVNCQPLPAKFLPVNLPIDRIEALSLVVNGKIDYETTPKLKRLYEAKKEKKTPEEEEAEK